MLQPPEHTATAREDPRTSATTKRPQARAPGVLALQHTRGNAAVARMLGTPAVRSGTASAAILQRALHLTDDGGRHLTDQATAEVYLRGAYQAHHKVAAVPADREPRLAELAAKADDPALYRMTLAGALAYIHDGSPLNVVPRRRIPSLSPGRDAPQGDWDYRMGGAKPTTLKAPMSPKSAFPSTAHPDVELDMAGALAGTRAQLTTAKAGHFPSKLGKNQVMYELAAHVRYGLLEKEADDAGAHYGPSSAPSRSSEAVYSPLFTSKARRPPTEKKGTGEDIELPIRTKLTKLRDTSVGHPYARKTSLHARAATGGIDFENALTKAISCRFFHSEVQAAAHADALGGGKQLVEQLMTKIIMRATGMQVPDGHVEVVVEAVTWTAASDPNSVCGGACKEALKSIGKVLEGEFNKQRVAHKPELAARGIHLRTSRKFTFSGFVAGEKKFGGFGKGASPSAGAVVAPPHQMVTEYDPHAGGADATAAAAAAGPSAAGPSAAGPSADD